MIGIQDSNKVAFHDETFDQVIGLWLVSRECCVSYLLRLHALLTTLPTIN